MLQVRVSSYLFPRTRPNNIIYLGMILYYLRIIVILIIQNIYLIWAKMVHELSSPESLRIEAACLLSQSGIVCNRYHKGR